MTTAAPKNVFPAEVPPFFCAGDPLPAARARPDTLFVRDMPLELAPGGRALAYLGASGAVLVTAARDFAGGFALHGEAVAPTPYRPGEVARASSDEHEPWEATLLRARRLIAQLTRWLDAELTLDTRARDLAALERWRRSEVPPACAVEVNGTLLSWCPAPACWSCLDLETGEVTRLAGTAQTLYDLVLAGADALSLAGKAWAYSLSDHRTPVAVCAREGGGWQARRASVVRGDELVVFSVGAQVFGKGRRTS